MMLIKFLVSYLVGSIPTGYLAGRILKGIDIRQHGSGNVGATNVFRCVGKIPGIMVLIIDIFKGFLAVSWLGAGEEPILRIIIGFLAIAGHNWTVFLKFKGGKGVATSAGVILALAPKVFLASLGVWVVLLTLTRYVSVGSIGAALALPVFAYVFCQPVEFLLFAIILCIAVCYKHRPNIKRLLKGEEKKILVPPLKKP